MKTKTETNSCKSINSKMLSATLKVTDYCSKDKDHSGNHQNVFSKWENQKEKQKMKTQTEVRQAFWFTFFVEGKPSEYRGKHQNDLPVDIRMAFVDYVDSLCKDKIISSKLAASVTL